MEMSRAEKIAYAKWRKTPDGVVSESIQMCISDDTHAQRRSKTVVSKEAKILLIDILSGVKRLIPEAMTVQIKAKHIKQANAVITDWLKQCRKEKHEVHLNRQGRKSFKFEISSFLSSNDPTSSSPFIAPAIW